METERQENNRKYARILLDEMCDKEEEIMWFIDNLKPGVKEEFEENIDEIIKDH